MKYILLAGLFLIGFLAQGEEVLLRGETKRDWEAISGKWVIEDGQASINETLGDPAYLLLAFAPIANEQVIEATVTILERTKGTGWSAGGLCLWFDRSNYWRLSLVEAPDLQTRYPELVELYEGIHQAQMTGATRLALTSEGRIDWQYGRRYRLRLELNEEEIRGEVKDLQSGDVWRIRYEFDGAPAVKAGVAGLWAQGFKAIFEDFSLRYRQEVGKGKPIEVEGRRIGIFRDETFPGEGKEVADYLGNLFKKTGLEAAYLDSEALSAQASLDPAHFPLLIFPDARYFPGIAKLSLLSYLRQGGRLVLIGAPSFTRKVWKIDGEWMDSEKIEEEKERYVLLQPRNMLFKFEELPSDWKYESNSPQNPVEAKLAQGIEGRCLEVSASLPGWGGIGSLPLERPFPPGHSLTCFWAKGEEATRQMSVEWREKDGSRWIAVVDLKPEWRFYALPPSAFVYWPDNPSKGRGGIGDSFNPENAQQILFGISNSHTPKNGSGKHTFWVDEVSTAPPPKEWESFPDPWSFSPISLEAVYPTYKIYPLTNIEEFRTSTQAVFLKPWNIKEKITGFSPVWRPQGEGYNRERLWRWLPLLEAYSGGEFRGAPVSLLLTPKNALLYIALQDPRDIEKSNLGSTLLETIKRMEKPFIFEGGAEHFLYYMGERVKLGVKVIGQGGEPTSLEAVCRVRKGEKTVFQSKKSLFLPPREEGNVEWEWTPPLPGDDYRVGVEIAENGTLLDRVEHPLSVISPPKNVSREDFIQVKGSDFYLRGKRWFPRGINYWPSMLGGLDADIYAGSWLSPKLYDPTLVERDLSLLEKMGINLVSAVGADIYLVGGEERAMRNLLDFLHRAERHNIKVMLYLAGAHPFNFDEERVLNFIKKAGLANLPVIFAYDIAWEPFEYPQVQGGGFDKDWEKWLIERYGSVENAEADWGCKLSRRNGRVSPPLGIENPRPWAAFLRFFSDLASRKYNHAIRRIKSVDPNHLISFRGGACGLPHAYGCAHLYSVGVAKHVDFLCPEGYNLQTKGYGNPTPWEDIRKGGLITLYYRFIGREKPVIWMEFAGPIWPNGTEWNDTMVWTPKERLEYQRSEVEKFYRMFVESGAKGCCPWWYPGGFRVGEMSDAGVINPDWVPRPVVEVIEKYNPLFASFKPPQPDFFIDLDFDAHPLDAWEVYSPIYLKALQEGKKPAVKTKGTGTTSLNTPLIAVGNTPYNGKNPPKYLNAEFNYIEIRDKEGRWREVRNGEMLEVKKGEVWCRASVGNIGEAEWIAPKKGEKGEVYLVVEGNGVRIEKGIAKNTPFLQDAEVPPFLLFSDLPKDITLNFQMCAKDRAFFGEKWRITLKIKE